MTKTSIYTYTHNHIYCLLYLYIHMCIKYVCILRDRSTALAKNFQRRQGWYVLQLKCKKKAHVFFSNTVSSTCSLLRSIFSSKSVNERLRNMSTKTPFPHHQLGHSCCLPTSNLKTFTCVHYQFHDAVLFSYACKTNPHFLYDSRKSNTCNDFITEGLHWLKQERCLII